MKLASHLEKSERYERLPDVFREFRTPGHRPRLRFKLVINTENQVKKALRAGVPVLWIDSSYTKMLRYPMTIPDTVVVPREYRGVVETELNLHTFQSLTPFRETTVPQLEDVVVFMLALDPLAARAMADRSDLDLDYLQKRIIQENMEREAAEVYLQDYLDIPARESPYDRARLLKIIERNKVREVIP